MIRPDMSSASSGVLTLPYFINLEVLIEMTAAS